MVSCASDNTEAIDQSSFWTFDGHWDKHRIGWLIAGVCSIVVGDCSADVLRGNAHNVLMDRRSSSLPLAFCSIAGVNLRG